MMEAEKPRIRVKMVCECGNTAYPMTENRVSENAIAFYDNISYICIKCGKIMDRKIIKTETSTIETIIQEK